MHRLSKLSKHIVASGTDDAPTPPHHAVAAETETATETETAVEEKPSPLADTDIGYFRNPALPPNFNIMQVIGPFVDSLPDLTERLTYDVADHLPGPHNEPGFDKKEWLKEWQVESRLKGKGYVKWTEYAVKYGGSMGSNFVLPIMSKPAKWTGIEAGITQQVMLGNPEDCRRIAKVHLKKQPNFTPLLGNSVISTLDGDHWKKQRDHLVETFLPMGSLAKICPISVARARKCTEMLSAGMAEHGSMNMNEFFLHEAQAQLQLALFGFDEEFMERTNKPLRAGFSGTHPDATNVRTIGMEFLEQIEASRASGESVAYGDVLRDGSLAVKGPLGQKITDMQQAGMRIPTIDKSADDDFTKLGNVLIFAFAGHDTTAHSMTWLTMEVARHPEVQRKLHAEIDAFFAELGDKPMEYTDMHKLKYLSRCIFETLRLWPAVANGTFRELLFDDVVSGPDGKEVHLPKGTYVQCTNWLTHRNPELWGPTVDEFNPDRDFTEEELWHGEHFTARNFATARFSPFTHSPRDCIGKNFAHMEMRTILSHLFHRFEFQIDEPEGAYDKMTRGVNRGTMGPEDMVAVPTMLTGSDIVTPQLGVQMRVKPRR